MGMVLALTMLGDRNIDRLLADPPLVWKVIAPQDPEAYERARRDVARPSFFSRLVGRKEPPATCV